MINFFFHEAWPGLMLVWLVGFLPLAVLSCAPIWWRGRKRVVWFKWEHLVFVVPYFTWASLLIANPSGKDWGNLWEGVLLGLATPLAPALRLRTHDQEPARTVAARGIVLVTAIGVLFWAFVPAL
jgi:hypothetical protein